jgi:hypothetical protein
MIFFYGQDGINIELEAESAVRLEASKKEESKIGPGSETPVSGAATKVGWCFTRGILPQASEVPLSCPMGEYPTLSNALKR